MSWGLNEARKLPGHVTGVRWVLGHRHSRGSRGLEGRTKDTPGDLGVRSCVSSHVPFESLALWHGEGLERLGQGHL